MSINPTVTGNFPTYRFFIATEPSSLSREVFPLNFNETVLVDEQVQGHAFYRRTFSGSLLFGTNDKVTDIDGNAHNRSDDWDFFWAFEQATPCSKIYLMILKITDTIENYWDGVFSTTDGFFDIDACTFEVTPLPNDDYVPIFDLADIKYNILSVTPIISTNAFIAGLINQDYTRNRFLFDVIEYIADEILTGVTVSSDFFTDATNPVTLNDNHLLYLTIAQKSDIVRPNSTDPATTAMMSWNELMNILWTMFQVQWDYDAVTDTINVEHESWWTSAAGIDLRTQLMTQSTNKYSYIKEQMPKYEKFSFMEADNINFVGYPIWYDSGCVDQNPDTNIRQSQINITTDLEYIYNNSAAATPDVDGVISDEGFVILCNYKDGANYFVEVQSDPFALEVKLNMHLSWAALHNYYFRHNRILISGYLNNILTTFWTAQKTKKQECYAIICDDYDPSDEITTELGEIYFGGAKAVVQKSELSPSGGIKFSLLYGPVANENTGVEDIKMVLIEQDTDCWTLHGTLTQAADMDIEILLTETIRDSLGAIVCTGAGETWTIVTGLRTDTFTFAAPCNGGVIPAGGCVEIAIDLTGAGAWLVDFNYDFTNCACS